MKTEMCCRLGGLPENQEEAQVLRIKDLLINRTLRILDHRQSHGLYNTDTSCDVKCEFWSPSYAKRDRRVNSHDDLSNIFDAQLLSLLHPQISSVRSRYKSILTIALSMESSAYYPGIRQLSSVYDATMHTSLNSTIPIPYLRRRSILKWGRAPILFNDTSITSSEQRRPAAVFVASNCASRNKREQLVRNLDKLLIGGVHRPGRCLNNVAWPLTNNKKPCTKHEVLRRYPFYLAFENSNERDYVTEKVFDALETGVLPVYFGSPNVDDFVPSNSVVKVSDFASIQDLASYLNSLLIDSAKYLKHFAWKQTNLPLAFRQRFDFIRAHSSCRLCRWVHSKKLGLNWDHKKQHILVPHRSLIPSPKCVNGKPNIHVVTAANERYARAAVNLALSARHFGATRVWLYDLGLEEKGLSHARRCHSFLQVIQDPSDNYFYPIEWRSSVKDFAWKALVIQDAVLRAKGPILYEDAGSEFRAPLLPIFEVICRDGYALFKGQDNSARRWVHDKAAACLGYGDKNELLRGKTSYHAGSIGIDYQSQAYFDLIVPWANASRIRDCTAPSGSSLANHRQDQAALTLIAYAKNYTRHHTRLMLSSQEIDDPNQDVLQPMKKIIFVSRGRSMRFTPRLYAEMC